MSETDPLSPGDKDALDGLAVKITELPLIALAAAMAAIDDHPGKLTDMHRRILALRRRALDEQRDVTILDAYVGMVRSRIRQRRGLRVRK